ncbi:MAG: helix-turn-helix transcriptional regulator [Ktedonobacteraceae bacterium]|nr:helix-turn-helix transcriptional regulator [Ktedonobacteraceae bacterium]
MIPRESGTSAASALSVSQKVLTHTLRELERHGLVERKVYPVTPPKVEYSLTELGLTLQEPLTHLSRWAETHIADLEKALAAQYDPTSISEGSK